MLKLWGLATDNWKLAAGNWKLRVKSLFNSQDHRELQDRVQRLNADQKPQWGKMTAVQMVAHLSDSLRMASGELEVAPRKVPIRFAGEVTFFTTSSSFSIIRRASIIVSW